VAKPEADPGDDPGVDPGVDPEAEAVEPPQKAKRAGK